MIRILPLMLPLSCCLLLSTRIAFSGNLALKLAGSMVEMTCVLSAVMLCEPEYRLARVFRRYCYSTILLFQSMMHWSGYFGPANSHCNVVAGNTTEGQTASSYVQLRWSIVRKSVTRVHDARHTLYFFS